MVRDAIVVTVTAIVRIDGDEGAAEKAAQAICAAADEAVAAQGREEPLFAGAGGSGWRYIEARDNAGRCEKCGAWTTDIESPNPIAALQRGARVGGDLLCDEHLPTDHPLTF